MTKVLKTTEKTIKKSIRKGFIHKNSNCNFWQELRVKSGLTCVDVAELVGVSKKTVDNHFRGHSMPTDYDIKRYCELFSVPFDKGKLEFENGYSAQHNHNSSVKRELTEKQKEDSKNYTVNAVLVETSKEDPFRGTKYKNYQHSFVLKETLKRECGKAIYHTDVNIVGVDISLKDFFNLTDITAFRKVEIEFAENKFVLTYKKTEQAFDDEEEMLLDVEYEIKEIYTVCIATV